MFAYLQESSQSFYDTSGFCSVFRDFDGTPVNVGVQQDASEFFTNFVQQIESKLAGTPHASLFKQNFSVGLTNLCDGGPGRRSETQDSCTLIRYHLLPVHRARVVVNAVWRAVRPV